jgi:hypothetical protein
MIFANDVRLTVSGRAELSVSTSGQRFVASIDTGSRRHCDLCFENKIFFTEVLTQFLLINMQFVKPSYK